MRRAGIGFTQTLGTPGPTDLPVPDKLDMRRSSLTELRTGIERLRERGCIVLT